MSYSFEILERVKSRVASVKANWGFPAATPLIDRVMSATAQIRARVAAVRARAGVGAPAPAAPPAAEYYYPEYGYEYGYQVPEEEKPEVK
jgi:hypothetical protein